MKTRIKNLFLLPALIAGGGLILAGLVTAQTFTTLYSFTGGDDGGTPQIGLISSASTLYGTALLGGSSGAGTVFAVSTNGTGFRTLYGFTGGSDGANPQAGLSLAGNPFYGTGGQGGDSGKGAVFVVNTGGNAFAALHNFTAFPPFPGPYGGSGNQGTVFAVNTDGTAFKNLHSFT